MRIALDTNVIAYAIGLNDIGRQARAIEVLDAIPVSNLVLPVQVMAELFGILTKKARLPRKESAQIVVNWGGRYAVEDTSASALMQSLQIAAFAHVTIWDAIVLATAIESDCRMLLSEDMRHGFTWSGVTVVNPFQDSVHPLLEEAMQSQQPEGS